LKQSPQQRETPQRGYAKLFEDCVLQADQGCDFDFLVRDGARTTPKKDE
jgi:dihydroxy-acid dehydratase